MSNASYTSWYAILMLWLAGIVAAMQFAKFSVAFNEFVAYYKTDQTYIGLALSLTGFVGLVFGVSAGVLSGHIGYRNVLFRSLLLGAALSFCQSFMPSLPVLMITRALEGIAHLGIVVCAPTLMVRAAAIRHRTFVMALWGTFFGIAFTLAGWLGPIIIKNHGLPAMLLAHSVLLTTTALLILRIPQLKKQKQGVVMLLSARGFFAEHLSVYANLHTVLPGVIFFFHTCMFIALLTFVPRLTESSRVSEVLLVALPLASIGGTFIAGALAQRVAPPSVIAFVAYAGVAVLAAGVGSLIEWPQAYLFCSIGLLTVSGIIQGAAFASIPYLNENLTDQARANGAVAQLGNLGATIGPPVFAAIVMSYGGVGFVVLTTLLCFAGGVCAFFANRISRSATTSAIVEVKRWQDAGKAQRMTREDRACDDQPADRSGDDRAGGDGRR